MELRKLLGLSLLGILSCASAAMAEGDAKYVITISVDGMGSSYMQNLIDEGKLPNMQKLRAEGATTINARTDYDFTITLPNHTCMVTSRGVVGELGHNWTDNGDPKPGETLHSRKGQHIASVFEVASDAGLRTGMWATKSKFSLFHESCKVAEAAESVADKMNVFCRLNNAQLITANYLEVMKQQPLNYTFLHFGDTDGAGHGVGWGSDAYKDAMIRVDGCIGQILNLIDSTEDMRGKTSIIITADHGGFEKDHGNSTLPLNYTIPFITWGAGVESGNLYVMNPQRQEPGSLRIPYDAAKQPVRNGDAGNLGMRLLGLKAIPGSTIGVEMDLKTTRPVKQEQPKPAAGEEAA